MEVVEDTLDVALDAFLARPLFCFLAQASPDGPRVSPLWYRWADGSIWIIATRSRSYVDRIADDSRSALAIVDFDPESGRVQHVGMRGRTVIEPFDGDLAATLLGRYLGEDRSAWPDRFRDLSPGDHAMLRFTPSTVVARDQSYRP